MWNGMPDSTDGHAPAPLERLMGAVEPQVARALDRALEGLDIGEHGMPAYVLP